MQGIYKTSAAMCASSKIFQWMNYLLTAYKCVFIKKFSLYNGKIIVLHFYHLLIFRNKLYQNISTSWHNPISKVGIYIPSH